MNVSVIIPAFNAAETISKTIESLQAQTFSGWEAIVIDDGSTDATASIVFVFAQKDPRIRIVHQHQSGVGAARNNGIRRARFGWLLFLDADDWISPLHLERLTGVLAKDPNLDFISCGYARVSADRQFVADQSYMESRDLFVVFAEYCAVTVHACIVRRSLVEAVGGFEPDLRTSEDWDLWQRIFRAGARFGSVPDVLAYYYMRPGSATTDLRQLMADGLRVIAQAHGPDPRVPNPLPVHAQGRPRELLPAARFRFTLWLAGLALGNGQDARFSLEALKEDSYPVLDARLIAYSIFQAALLNDCQTPDIWITLWDKIGPQVINFLLALEEQTKCSGVSRLSQTMLEHLIVEHAKTSGPLTLGTMHRIQVEATQAISDIIPPASVTRLLCAVELEGKSIGTVDLPVCDGRVPARVLADAIAAECGWTILGRFFERGIYRQFRIEREPTGHSLWRGKLRIAGGLPEKGEGFWKKAHDQIGWTVLLQEIWGRPDQPGEYFYDLKAEDTASVRRFAANGPIVIEASEEMPEVEIPGHDVEVILTVGGAPIGAVSVLGDPNVISPQKFRVVLTTATGFDLCVAAVREALLSRPITEPIPLRQRLAEASAKEKALRDASAAAGQTSEPLSQTVTLGRRNPHQFETSASRRASLPLAALPELLEAATGAGEPTRRQPQSGAAPVRIEYDPDWIVASPRAGNAAGQSLRMGSSPPESGKSSSIVTARLPILMYHRIASDGSPVTAPYRLSPEKFEEQLRYLSGAGYYSIDLEDWRAAISARKPLPGRAVLITFDDGYRDFLTDAWPLLKRHGFSATVFLVADEIGGVNRWDHAYKETVPLLNWPEILRLQQEGVAFGSHAASHPRLTSLSAADVVREAAHSRAVLERGLGVPVRSLAYPYGAEDRVIHHLTGACGYTFGLTCRPGFSEMQHRHLLTMPRIEVEGSDTLQDFIRKMGP